ncbi:S-adenosyl-L-methionine-dependent methyltransferase [Gigaspora margarita]|uniref:S-adenosyl-L-methionine-dependent methyltransferase n=1 Tax=Gigaspora margarita TaxID=4874 RepID=A0A8H3XHE7_GIGMA|nr:S-adenosyl-L-methionine-dependent methyltransferase [Gigaspora margarita]
MESYNSKIQIVGLESTNNNLLNESNKSTFDKSYFGEDRRYTAENTTYFLPNDDKEHNRLHLQHNILKFIWQGNFFAPVEHLLNQEETKVLDVGAGSWLLDMATNYPKAKFTGLDISPAQPVPAKKWQSVINELVRILKPGGYLEWLDLDFQYKTMGPVKTKIINAIVTMSHERGLDPDLCYKLQGFLEEHNQLHNIHCEIKEKFNGDEKFCKLWIENYSAVLMGMKSNLMNILKVSSDEYDDLVKTVGKELTEFEAYYPHVRVYAQKKLA